MSEIQHFCMLRASVRMLPPGISEPFAPQFRPVRPRRPGRLAKGWTRLRRFAGRRLLDLGGHALRLGRRWAEPPLDSTSLSVLKPVR
ncbi:hypothetical protein [Pelagibius sp.]|uniref:hypothetical protein n=1 Tax=Pelagibius sp. TaxID=1931238 RepID=UPI002636F29A|nr:hypothetical protein [Pelagibius sp.]